MKGILDSVAARAANGWERAGSKFDFEVFAMPGGSVMAPALWVYSMVASVLKRSGHSVDPRPADVLPADAQSADKQPAETGLSCAWPRCHCS